MLAEEGHEVKLESNDQIQRWRKAERRNFTGRQVKVVTQS